MVCSGSSSRRYQGIRLESCWFFSTRSISRLSSGPISVPCRMRSRTIPASMAEVVLSCPRAMASRSIIFRRTRVCRRPSSSARKAFTASIPARSISTFVAELSLTMIISSIRSRTDSSRRSRR